MWNIFELPNRVVRHRVKNFKLPSQNKRTSSEKPLKLPPQNKCTSSETTLKLAPQNGSTTCEKLINYGGVYAVWKTITLTPKVYVMYKILKLPHRTGLRRLRIQNYPKNRSMSLKEKRKHHLLTSEKDFNYRTEQVYVVKKNKHPPKKQKQKKTTS